MIRHCLGCGLFLLLVPAVAVAQLDFGPERKSDVEPATELPEKLQPKKPRTEAEEDQITAAAHFSQGKLLQAKGKTALAVRHYQRAWRYDESLTPLLSEIVSLSFDIRQSNMATRYAVLAAERDPRDPLLIRRLAIYLTEKRDFRRAAKMYEKSLLKDKQIRNGMPEDVGAATVYAELARLYYLNEQYAKAAETIALVRRGIEQSDSPLDEMAKKSVLGDEATTYALWGESFLEAGKHDDAVAMFRQADKAKPDAPLLSFRLARVEFARKNADQAIQHLNDYLAAKTDTSGSSPYELLGKIVIQQAASPAAGQEQLIRRLKELQDSQPENVPLAFALADALWTSGRVEEAVPLLTKWLARQPSPERYARLIEHHWRQKQYRELLAAAGQLAERGGSLEAIEELVKKLAKDEGLIQGCIVLAREQAMQKEPAPAAGPILAAAILAREAGQVKPARELFQAVLDLKPENPTELRMQWSLGLLLADHPEAAAEMFYQVLEQKPRNAAAVHYYLAGTLALADRTDDALREIRAAIAANPDNPRFESRVGWILYRSKRYAEAAAEYEQLLKKYSDRQQLEVREMLRTARLTLSNLALEQDDFPQAVEWLEQVLDEFPEDAGALNDLGYLWADRGLHLQRALRMTQKAVELEPENQSYRDSLGWAYYRLGRYEEAVNELTIATNENDDADGVLFDHLGDALAKLGKRDEALKAWKRAVEAFRKAEEEKKVESVQEKLSRS